MSILFGFLLCLTGIFLTLGVLFIARLQHEIRMDLDITKKMASQTEGIIRDIIFIGGLAVMYFGGRLILVGAI